MSNNSIFSLFRGTVVNQFFRRIFYNSDFFQTHVHLGTLTFEKNQNHKNFLEKIDLRQCLRKQAVAPKKAMINNIFEAVGDTAIVKVKTAIPDLNIFAKLEFMNPNGSVKDRIVKFILDKAKKDGLIKQNSTIVEASSGNTGIAVASYAAANGLKAIIVISNKMSQDKIETIRAFGAKVIVVEANVAADDVNSYYQVAKRIAGETADSFYINQYHNLDNSLAHYHLTGAEIYQQIKASGKKFAAIFIGIGTSGTISGVAKYVKERDPSIKIVGVDTYGSILEHYFKTGEIANDAKIYAVEGIGEDMIPENFDKTVIDDIIKTNDLESFEAARRLAFNDGIFAGGSSGAAIAGVEKYSALHGLKGNVLTILPDSGARYLSKFHSQKWFDQFKKNFNS